MLADFDRGAEQVLGMPPRDLEKRFGLPGLWSKLAKQPSFYANLPLRTDAMDLIAAVGHLDPVILTGCPRGGWAEEQKVRWVAEHFPGTKITTRMACDRRDHAAPGEVLLDDTLRHRDRWEDMGGIFV